MNDPAGLSTLQAFDQKTYVFYGLQAPRSNVAVLEVKSQREACLESRGDGKGLISRLCVEPMGMQHKVG